MEFVSGKALNQLIARKGLPVAEALKYAVQIADARRQPMQRELSIAT
jgi:hypothetical protein